LNIDFGIKNENQDCKIGIVGGAVLKGGGGEMEEMKVRDYDWLASYAYTK
jgi:hypothetical protein